MALNSPVKSKAETSHLEDVSPAISLGDDLDYLDSIETTQSGKFAWLVSTTAGVGGLLFGQGLSLHELLVMLNKHRIRYRHHFSCSCLSQR
jgi:SP family myo-inositol transporter-like MFS transporter 13